MPSSSSLSVSADHVFVSSWLLSMITAMYLL